MIVPSSKVNLAGQSPDGKNYTHPERTPNNPIARRNDPMTSQEVNAAIRQSLGLPQIEENKPTVPVEGHVCDFPI